MASTVFTEADAAYWPVPLVRAVLAAALACVITFAQGNYSPELGLFTFAGYTILAGLAGGILTLRGTATGTNRNIFLAQAIVSILAGVLALVGWRTGLPLLIIAFSSWAILTGGLELFAGLRTRGRRAASRDWTFIGAVTVVFAVVILVIPPSYYDRYFGPDKKFHVLNASVMDVGTLGVYGAIVAVYLVIAALSLRWAGADAKKAATGTASEVAS